MPSQRLLIGWACLIFITSCFVVPLDTFVHAIQSLSGSVEFQKWFGWFWVADGFFIVKGWHITEYAVLVSLLIITLRLRRIGGRFGSVALGLAVAVAFAASDEWHQSFVPGRDGCVRDVFIDTGGALLAAFGWSVQAWLGRHGSGRVAKVTS